MEMIPPTIHMYNFSSTDPMHTEEELETARQLIFPTAFIVLMGYFKIICSSPIIISLTKFWEIVLLQSQDNMTCPLFSTSGHYFFNIIKYKILQIFMKHSEQ